MQSEKSSSLLDLVTSDEGTRDSDDDSFDFNRAGAVSIGSDDISEDSHQRGFGEAAARGFFPISEETMDVTTMSSSPSSPPSPMSMDCWTLYPGKMRSPASSTLGECSSSEDASSSSMSTFNLLTSQTNKRTCHFQETESEDDDSYNVNHDMSSDEHKDLFKMKNLLMKRQKFTDSEGCNGSDKVLAGSSSGLPVINSKRRLMNSTRSVIARGNAISVNKDPRVDVRMIDFAHTTFSSRREVNPQSANMPVHHGPDCGFLTGLDSLKRLLLEILADEDL